MNYLKHYERLIVRARTRSLEGYFEEHHVLPRCIGGSDHIDNLVQLTPEEHYVAHQLLIKIYPNETALIYAAKMLSLNANQNRPNNKLYGWLKRRFSAAHSQRMTGRIPWNKGKTGVYTDEAIRKMSESSKGSVSPRKGVTLSIETRNKISSALKGHAPSNKGQKRSQEANEKQSKTMQGRVPWNKNKTGYKMPASSDAKKQKISASIKKSWEKRKNICY